MSPKSVLITGVAGFIGSHLSERLLRRDIEVVGIDNYDDFYSQYIKLENLRYSLSHEKFKFIQGDISDASIYNEIMKLQDVDLVIHLAAKAGVRPSLADPVSYFNVNLGGTLRLLEFMKAQNIGDIIFASSSSVYGNNIKVPFSESDIVDFPISPYAATKKAGELLCYTYHHLFDMDVSCLRFFTVYGPRQRPDLAIHKFTDMILAGKEIPVYGDGKTLRDYTYIDDIVDGVMRAIYNLSGYNVYNLGESKVISLNEMIQTLEDKLNIKAKIKRMEMQPGDVLKTYADISKAKKELGYDPKWSFEAGVEEFVKWKLQSLNK